MKKIVVAFLVIFIFSLFAADNIKVIVLDANDLPIEGALVKIEYKTALTDAQGIATLGAIYDLGDVSMTVTKDGYASYSTVFQAQSNMVINVRLYSSTVGYIRGAVYINDREHPANKYIVEVYDSKTNGKIDTIVTDDQGRFSYPTNADRKCYLIVRGFTQKFEATPSSDPTAEGMTVMVQTTLPTTPAPSGAIVTSDTSFLPGFIVVYGKMAASADMETSYDASKAIDFWYKDTPTRFQVFSDSLHHSFVTSYNAAKPEVISGIGYIDKTTDDVLDGRKGFLVVSVGGPQVNLYTRSLNERLRVKFVPDATSVDKWHILDTQNNYVFDSSGVGIITFIPNPSYLDASVSNRIKSGDKRIGTLILAGNAREGTYAAAFKFSEFMHGSSEGSAFRDNLDKILLWLFTGENQQIQPITFVVEYMSPTQVRVLGIIVG